MWARPGARGLIGRPEPCRRLPRGERVAAAMVAPRRVHGVVIVVVPGPVVARRGRVFQTHHLAGALSDHCVASHRRPLPGMHVQHQGTADDIVVKVNDPFNTFEGDHPSRTVAEFMPGLKYVMLSMPTMPSAGATPPTRMLAPLGFPERSPLLKLTLPSMRMSLSVPRPASD